MSYVQPSGLGASMADFQARRLQQTWARSGDTVEGTAGHGWVKPGTYSVTEGKGQDGDDFGDGDAVNGGFAVVPEPPPIFTPLPPPPPPPSPEVLASEVVPEPAMPEPQIAPAAPPTIVTAPALVDITVQLRNSGNLNAPGANTNLRFSMPGIGGSLCAVGAAVGQLPAGTRANTHLLGEWFLTGEWGGSLGCSFTAHSASQGRPVVAETEIPAQETPYTPGADYCPPGQIPKTDGDGCYEPCPMRSQTYNEVTGECEDITCPPGTIVGAGGECVELVQTDAGPIGVPYVEPEASGGAQESIITTLEPTKREFERYTGEIVVDCFPGWTEVDGECFPTDKLDGGDTDEPPPVVWIPPAADDPVLYGDWEYAGKGDPEDDVQYGIDDPGAEAPIIDSGAGVFYGPDATDPGGGGVGPIYGPIFGPIDGGPIYNGAPVDGGPGAPGPGGGGVITNGNGAPLLSPGVAGDGFGFVEVALGAALAWVLAQSYSRAPR